MSGGDLVYNLFVLSSIWAGGAIWVATFLLGLGNEWILLKFRIVNLNKYTKIIQQCLSLLQSTIYVHSAIKRLYTVDMNDELYCTDCIGVHGKTICIQQICIQQI